MPATTRPRSPTHPARSRQDAAVASSQIDALTGIRAIAALWVVGFHFGLFPLGSLGLDDALPVLRYGYLGVDLFFVLSGFIIYHVHQRDAGSLSIGSVLHFYGLRLARMYPVHLLTLCGLGPIDIQDSRRHECVIHRTPDSSIWSSSDGQAVRTFGCAVGSDF